MKKITIKEQELLCFLLKNHINVLRLAGSHFEENLKEANDLYFKIGLIV